MNTPYYPYRAYKVVAWFFAVFGLGCICLAIFSLINDAFDSLSLSITGLIILIWFFRTIAPSIKTHITCDSDCIYINEKNVQYCVSWNNLTNKYRSHDSKGRQHLILSRRELQKTDIKKAIKQGSFKSQVCFDNCFVIYLDMWQPQLVQELVQYIDANMDSKLNGV